MDAEVPHGWLRQFDPMPDPRHHNIHHPLSDLIAIALLAVNCGAEIEIGLLKLPHINTQLPVVCVHRIAESIRLTESPNWSAVQRRVRRFCAAAGVKPRKRLWQTLRSSGEIEWAMRLPQYAVSRWIGPSIEISGRHYANRVPDELFTAAARYEPGAAHNAAQKGRIRTGIIRKPSATRAEGFSDHRKSGQNSPQNAINACGAEEWSRGESNPRAVTVSGSLLRV